jgi:hypothetical protein
LLCAKFYYSLEYAGRIKASKAVGLIDAVRFIKNGGKNRIMNAPLPKDFVDRAKKYFQSIKKAKKEGLNG